MTVTAQFKFSGPLFTGPKSKVRGPMEAAVRELVGDGESKLAKILSPRPSGVYLSVAQAGRNASKGNYRGNLSTQFKGLHGTITDGGVVYGPWLEGLSSRNRTTRFEGYMSFRKVAQFLQRNALKVVQSHINKMVRNLGG